MGDSNRTTTAYKSYGRTCGRDVGCNDAVRVEVSVGYAKHAFSVFCVSCGCDQTGRANIAFGLLYEFVYGEVAKSSVGHVALIEY